MLGERRHALSNNQPVHTGSNPIGLTWSALICSSASDYVLLGHGKSPAGSDRRDGLGGVSQLVTG